MEPVNFIDKDGNAVCVFCGKLAPHKKEPYLKKQKEIKCSHCGSVYYLSCFASLLCIERTSSCLPESEAIPENQLQGIIALRWLRKTKETDIIQPFADWLVESKFVGKEAFSEEMSEILIAYQIHLKELSYITCS